MIRGWLCESVRRKVAVLDTVSTKLLSVSSKTFFVRFFKSMRVRRCEKTIMCSCWYGLPFRLSTTSKKSILVMSHDIIGAIYLTTSIRLHVQNSGSQSPAAIDDLRSSLSAAFASPSLLNASFCFPGLYKPRLDAGGLLNVS